jgi:ferredoxin
MARIPYLDQDACISCGLCVECAPEVFRLNNAIWRRCTIPVLPEEKIRGNGWLSVQLHLLAGMNHLKKVCVGYPRVEYGRPGDFSFVIPV